MTRTRIRWSALRDGIAHAHAHDRDMRTLCGQPAIAERDAWPTFRRCLACRALVEDLESPATEAELRMLWGDR
jgi:hypothetical protein